ncbi:MAG: DUF5677 domain-containing protein [Candidatus Acidiferrales bacterium]
MMPHEAEVTAEIAEKYRVQLQGMTALHSTVVRMLSQHWTIRKPRGVPRFVAETMVGLLIKACKTFRAIQILCERGFCEDANALVRVLMETTVAIGFILQKKSKERALIYHAHGIAQNIKMLNEWKNTPGLKRKATKAVMKQANDALAGYMTRLPAGTDVKRHWSGKPSLQEAVKALRGDALYATLYRFTSSISHASDFGIQFEVDPFNGELVWQTEPTVNGFEAPSYAARQLLWNAANRIDHRLGLGFSTALGPYNLTRADVQKGQK